MKTLFVVTLLGFSLLLQDLPASQEQKREPQTISTEPKEVVAELRMGDKKLSDVRGETVFTPTQGNADDTLTGTLAFNLSETERKRIAALMEKPFGEIPSIIKKDGVSTSFERHAKCPDLSFEFFIRHLNFDVSLAEAEFGVATLRFQPFVLSFKESESELSKVLCRWKRRIDGGRQDTAYWKAFNSLLNGENPYK